MNKHSLALAIALALLPGCKSGDGSKPANAATPGDGFQSTASGEYSGMRTAEVNKGDVVVVLPGVGTLAPITRVEVKSVLSGRIIEIHVREGDVVKIGQKLATLEPGIDQLRELSLMATGVQKASLELKDAEVDLKNTQALSRKGFASNDQVKAAEKRYAQSLIDYNAAVAQRAALASQGVPVGNAARALESFDVMSPGTGVVVDRKVEVGEVVSSGMSGFNQGTVLFEVADLGELKVDLFVNEVDVGKLEMDYPAEITVDAFRGKKWPGAVSHIAPQARQEGEIRGFDVEIKLKDNPGRLRPGMTANVDITGEETTDVVRVPIEALFRKKGDDVVYVIKDGKPESLEVEVGLISLDWVEVKSGVDEGTEIAVQHPERFLEEKRDEGRRRR